MAARKESVDRASTLVQMHLKMTDTTTGISEKDIKSMMKLNFTNLMDFHKSLLNYSNTCQGSCTYFKWNHFLLMWVAGPTLSMFCLLANKDTSAACRLRWIVKKRMQHYFVQ